MKKELYLIIVFSFLVCSFDFAEKQTVYFFSENKQAEKIDLKGFKNLFKINENIYRAEQPDKNGMIELQQIGIHTILDLRNLHNDKKEAKNTKLILERVPINTWKISYNDILKSLKIIAHSEKPILIHCLHGSDRTGCIIAAYRMAYENWSKDEAIKEFTDKNFGYHEAWFPNILVLLKSLNIESLKKDLDIIK